MIYYSVERSTDHLAHYGVKGMKWGVRKALARGNEKALDRHFRKAAKKLRKLQDIGLNSKKYAAKSAAYGAAAAGIGTLAVGGTNMLGNIANKAIGAKQREALAAQEKALRAAVRRLDDKGSQEALQNFLNYGNRTTGDKIKAFGNKAYVTKPKTSYIVNQYGEKEVLPGTRVFATRTEYEPVVTGNTIYRLGTGAIAAGLAAKSAQNAYRAKNGAKYRQKAVNFKNEMDNAFRGTKYEGQYIALPKKKKRRR